MSAVKAHSIYFEIDGQGYAIPAIFLSGAETCCPFLNYAGLPKGVRGIVQWNSKIFPVISFPSVSNDKISTKTCAFVFSMQFGGALAVPGKIGLFFPKQLLPLPAGAAPYITGQVVDSQGRKALQLDLGRLMRCETEAKLQKTA